MKKLNFKKEICTKWYKELRNEICAYIQAIENQYGQNSLKFLRKKWKREPKLGKDQGGGEMSILRGKIFEKAGVNISTVYGNLSKEFKGKIPGTEKNSFFWASGISLVIHPKSPKIPAVHMNTRFINTKLEWFGGGADITPVNKKSKESQKLAKIFHEEFKIICENYKLGCYKKYKKWCDDYFYLPHRNEHRGLGGIFYDNLSSNNWDSDFNFNKDVGLTFLSTYKKVVQMTIKKKWNNSDLELQAHRRSRYAEFNLLYDRGTKFGLMTNGNPDAIFMSLPPSASW